MLRGICSYAINLEHNIDVLCLELTGKGFSVIGVMDLDLTWIDTHLEYFLKVVRDSINECLQTTLVPIELLHYGLYYFMRAACR